MKTMKIFMTAVLLIPLWLTPALFAGQHGHSGHHGKTSHDRVHQGHGTVESVDLAEGTVRMEHGPIESLRWPQMVMDLKTKDPEMLNGLKEGDRIVFDLVQTDKGFLITRIEQKN
jgi:Cu/Ag efflux protein CusF